jgi:transmembrane 9 superfamily member 2/4
MSTIYWGGVPVGNRKQDLMNINTRYNFTSNEDTDEDTILINNHWNIHIWYRPSKDTVDSYTIVQVSIEPFSLQQEYVSTLTGTSTKMASCNADNEPAHTSFDSIVDIPVQPLTLTTPISFTYDVIWTEAPDSLSYNKRWNIYLSMNDAIPNYVEFAGFFLGGFIFVALTCVLCTWVLRDLSYKPIIDESHEDDSDSTVSQQTVQVEVQMWPLSTRIFFPPTHGRLLLCIGCGSGAQLFLTSLFYIILFRVGIISQSQGARIITPGAILYCLCSVSGGYVTARLYAIFHGDFKVALALCLFTAIAYPLIGLFAAYIVYDILPGSNAPEYSISSNIAPLIVLWIFFIWPVTVVGGYVGYGGGALQNFPVSEGSAGYHDLNLQNDRKKESDHENRSRKYMVTTCIKKHRILILLLTGGFLPILSCFVNYSYGVAGPILLGYYSVRLYMISSFVLFMLISGVQAVLMFYRQIRTQRSFEWWWATFSAAGSAGIYIYVLSISYLLFRGDESNINGTTILLYMIWFAFTSFGVFLMTGFMGVALNIFFIRTLYTYIMNRQH